MEPILGDPNQSKGIKASLSEFMQVQTISDEFGRVRASSDEFRRVQTIVSYLCIGLLIRE